MLLCPHCGVELADSSRSCPLCRAALHPAALHQAARSGEAPSTYPDKAQDPEDFEALSAGEKLKIFIEIYSVCSAIACFVVLAVEILLSKRIWWSAYPVVSVCFAWVLVCVPILLRRHPWIVFAILAPTAALFVLAIDFLTSGVSWFLPVGLPIVLLIEAAALLCIVLSVASKRKGLNIIAIGLLGVAIIGVGIETVLGLNYAQRIMVTWSAVVATVALPIAGLLFYLHYRITNRASLKKLFRL
jgi:Family of unknown function (DUF6320)